MTTYPAPNPPYLGPAAHHGGSSNKPIARIVIHSTVSATVEGGARSTASYFRSASAGGSAHYIVDPGEVVQSVYDSVVAYHAPPNEHSLGIEMCDMPDANSAKRWDGPDHQRMLDRTAQLTAQLCLAYDVPVTFLSVADLKAGMHGITTHNNVSQAFHESSHWDPGAWPADDFMSLVRDHADAIRGGHDDTSSGDDDMPAWKNLTNPTDRTLTADGQWHTLSVDQGKDGSNYYSVLTGPAYASGTLHVALKGLAKDHEVDTRFILVDVASGEDVVVAGEGSTYEHFADSTSTAVTMPFAAYVTEPAKGFDSRKLRFQIRAYGGEKVTIQGTRVRMLYWVK